MKFPIDSEQRNLFAPYRCVLQKLARFAADRAVKLFVVGGAVREMIAVAYGFPREPISDVDLASAENPLKLAHDFARETNGAFVLLDDLFPTARVVLQGNLNLDFSQFRADDLRGDLSLRDFTINSIAIDLESLLFSPSPELIDPMSGCSDMLNKLIRVCSARSITDDPIRILRAYRFAASLGFSISSETQDAIRTNASLLSTAAMERVRTEFFRLLSSEKSHLWIRQMDVDGVLETILPEIVTMKGVEQNRYHHLDVWKHTLLALELFEKSPIPEVLNPYRDKIEAYLSGRVEYGTTRKEIIKLALLIHDIGKPETREVDSDGRVHFYGHDSVGAGIARRICVRLRISRKASDMIETLIRNHLRLMHLSGEGQPSERLLYRFIRTLGEDWIGEALMSVADLGASMGPARSGDETERTNAILSDLAQLYFVEMPRRMNRVKLITGWDVMEKFGLKPGKTVGEILKGIEEAQATGQIETQEEAIELARKILAKIRGDEGCLP